MPPARRPAYLRPDFLERFAAPEHLDNGVVLYRLLDAEREPIVGRGVLRNGGFERSERDALEGWQLEGRPRVDRSGGAARSGSAAVAVDASSHLLSEAVNVTPGRIYRLRLHARTDGTDAEGRFSIQFLAEDRRVVEGDRLPYYPDAEYRAFETLSMAPANARSVRVVLSGGSGPTPIWVDDVTLTRLDG